MSEEPKLTLKIPNPPADVAQYEMDELAFWSELDWVMFQHVLNVDFAGWLWVRHLGWVDCAGLSAAQCRDIAASLNKFCRDRPEQVPTDPPVVRAELEKRLLAEFNSNEELLEDLRVDLFRDFTWAWKQYWLAGQWQLLDDALGFFREAGEADGCVFNYRDDIVPLTEG